MSQGPVKAISAMSLWRTTIHEVSQESGKVSMEPEDPM